MLSKLNEFIRSNKLFTQESKLLIATSGGVDSVVLCHLLSRAKYDFAIAHCNFQLRGKESDLDEKFVKKLSNQFNVPFHTKQFSTQIFSEENKVSIQLAARQLRYEWFYEICSQYQIDLIVTAHHASDQSETVLYNLIKGSGISGIRGIPAKNGNVVRPLLFASKDEIIQYAYDHNLTWSEDASNKEDKYSRNLIRNKIIPELKRINDSLDQTMLRNTERFRSMETFIKSEVSKIKTKYLSTSEKELILNLDWLTNDNGIVLHHILSNYGFNYFQTKELIESIGQSGRVFLSESHQLLIDRKKLFISPKEAEQGFRLTVKKGTQSVNVNSFLFTFIIKKRKGVVISEDKNIAFVDYHRITFPILIRNWKDGDRFVPLGMNSEKKLSDFMIDEKIPVNLKKRLPLFVSNNQIFWVAGHRINDRFKITNSTDEVLIIEMKSQNA